MSIVQQTLQTLSRMLPLEYQTRISHDGKTMHVEKNDWSITVQSDHSYKSGEYIVVMETWGWRKGRQSSRFYQKNGAYNVDAMRAAVCKRFAEQAERDRREEEYAQQEAMREAMRQQNQPVVDRLNEQNMHRAMNIEPHPVNPGEVFLTLDKVALNEQQVLVIAAILNAIKIPEAV